MSMPITLNAVGPLLPSKELENYFKANNNRITTKENIVIELGAREHFHSYVLLEECNGEKWELHQEIRDTVEFINENQIESIEGLLNISPCRSSR
jgi:hypothetical protein